MKLGRSPEARGLLPRKAEPTVEEKPVVPRGGLVNGGLVNVGQPSTVDAVLVRNDPGGGVLLQQPRELQVRATHATPEEFFRDVRLDTCFDGLYDGLQYRVVIETNPSVMYADFTLSMMEYRYLRSEETGERVLRHITASVVARVEGELRRKLRAVMEMAR